jgi:microcystin-dependent protein
MENYLGEIRIFAGNYAPENWMFCKGQLVSIAEYDALYALLGTTYGGDGQTTFALPNLQSRVPVGMGQGPGTSNYVQGQMVGTENVTLLTMQMPAHQHPVQAAITAVTGGSKQQSPTGARFGDQGGSPYSASAGTAKLASDALVGTLAPAGGSQPHTNVQPVLALNFIIAMAGIYPSQP